LCHLPSLLRVKNRFNRHTGASKDRDGGAQRPSSEERDPSADFLSEPKASSE
jgi:hypothetical protein